MGFCEFCHRYDGHDSRCPMAEQEHSGVNCWRCGEEIKIGDSYIRNPETDEYVHDECMDKYEIVDFLQGEYGEMR